MNIDGKPFRTVWLEGSVVNLIDQPRLPHSFGVAKQATHRDTANAIETMVVRGAGAIGATGAFGMAQAVLEAPDEDFIAYVLAAAGTLRATRPTAQNLFFGIDQVLAAIEPLAASPQHARAAAVEAAQAVADDDAACCRAIGQHGLEVVREGARVSTHCNAGWLAFVDWGSAIAPIYAAHRAGREVFVWVDETRPRSQGARLTSWELMQEGVEHAVIADNAAGALMRRGLVDVVIVGADRIAANGDIANKIGTYSSAVCARENGIPFYVAAPTTTIDTATASGEGIPIEERHGDEVGTTWGLADDGAFLRVRTVPSGARCHNPAFDVTPARYITGIITERGIVDASPAGIASVARH
jgi:S-methyl-5-thioribose-1-phosphate isomerase